MHWHFLVLPARAFCKAALAMSGLAPSSAFSPLIWGCVRCKPYTATLRHSFTLRGEFISLGRLLVLCLTHISCARACALFCPIFPSLRTPTATPPLTYRNNATRAAIRLASPVRTHIHRCALCTLPHGMHSHSIKLSPSLYVSLCSPYVSLSCFLSRVCTSARARLLSLSILANQVSVCARAKHTRTHRHPLIHTPTHTRARTRTRARAHTNTHTHTYTYTHIHTACTHLHTHTHTHTHTLYLSPSLMHKHTHVHTYTHKHKHTNKNTNQYARASRHTRTHTCVHHKRQ